MRKKGILLLIILAAFLGIQRAPAQEPDDPYLWLEDVLGEKSLDWVHQNNKISLGELKSHPEFSAIYDKCLERYNAKERIPYPSFRGDYLYNFWQDENHVRGVWRRTTLDEYMKPAPEWEIVLDLDALSEAEGEKWVYKGASFLYPGFKRCMVYLSRGGSDATEMREFDLVSKSFIKDGFFVPEAKGSVAWIDKNTLMVSTDFGPGTMTESGYPRTARIWKRGVPLEKAELVFEGETGDMGVWGFVAHTPERDYIGVQHAITFYRSKTHVMEEGRLVHLDIPEDAQFGGFFKDQLLVKLMTEWETGGRKLPQGALVSISYPAFLKGSRDFVIVENPDKRSSIVSFSNTRNCLYINGITDVRSHLHRYMLRDGKWIKEKVPSSEMGSIGGLITDDFTDRYFFTYEGFLQPSTLYFTESATDRMKKVKSLPAYFDAERYTVHQYKTASKDGTEIPYFVVHARNLTLDGSNPTLLYGYGGFLISMRPSYLNLVGDVWLERGGVYVLANIRGGGEFGPRWHQAALKENRQRAYDDFIAVAEDLVRRKITSAQRLGIQGGSNGGLLVGVAFTQRPDLFNAVVCAVPLLDMKRYNKLLAGASWMAEYGNPDIPEEWEYIRKYSPYQNVFGNKTYPRVLFITSTRDDRVHPGHARKMVAKMKGQGHDVLYYENTEGGHAAAVTNRQRALRSALIYSYLLRQLKGE
jgi:prolyl oligopeptidase